MSSPDKTVSPSVGTGDQVQREFFLKARYRIEMPDFWHIVDRHQFRVRSDEVFEFEMFQREEDDTNGGGKYWSDLTDVFLAHKFPLSSKAFETIDNLNSTDKEGETREFRMPDTPIPGRPDVSSHSWIPSDFWTEILQHQESLDRIAFDLINKLCWRLGIHDGPSLVDSDLGDLQYSTERKQYDQFPVITEISFGKIFQRYGTATDLNDALNFLASPYSPPLHHVVFQEAWRRRHGEPRVAIVMAVVAAESAVKALVSDLLPATRWILENLQSPSIVKIVRELFAELPARCLINRKVVRPPKPMIAALQEAVELRNKIVHGRPEEISDLDLEHLLDQIRDFLALVDYYSGQPWALKHIAESTRKELGLAS